MSESFTKRTTAISGNTTGDNKTISCVVVATDEIFDALYNFSSVICTYNFVQPI